MNPERTPLRVLSIFGTRPEAIKMAPVVRELQRRAQDFASFVCLTGQHRELVAPILRLFDLHADYDLDLMRPGQSLHAIGAGVFAGLEPILARVRPHWVVVQGDTTTAAVAGLAAHYAAAEVAHVEAGLRSYDFHQPFPEEVNRRVLDHLSSLHFAPTAEARGNLLREGIRPERIHVTGNTGIDALLAVAQRPSNGILRSLGVDSSRKTVLVTTHRRESFGEPIDRVCQALRQVAEQASEAQFVFPVHPNPNVRRAVQEARLRECSNLILTEPLDYEPFIHLLKSCALVLTDSGGLQEEAPAIGIPVLVLREVTERPEGVAAGAAVLVGTCVDTIVRETLRLLRGEEDYRRMARPQFIYGDGRAAARIADALLAYGHHERAQAAGASA